MSSDFESRLISSLASAFADAHAPAGVLDAVRRRRRLRLTYRAIASAAIAATLTVGIAYGVRLATQAHSRASTAGPGAGFPGGGRLLVVDAEGLKWINSDGTVSRLGDGFTGATLDGDSIVASKPVDGSLAYYSMRLDGQGSQLILPPAPKGTVNTNEVLSPDASRVAYVREVDRGNAVTDTLWVRNIATGQERAVDPVSRDPIFWLDENTILASSEDVRQLITVDVTSGHTETYLSTAAPDVIGAYEGARPGAGPPRYIHADGWAPSQQTGPLAVSIASQNGAGIFSQPMEALVQNQSVVKVVAPSTPQQLDFAWGPGGAFVVQTGAGDNPASWKALVGRTDSKELTSPYQTDGNGAAIGPGGHYLAVEDDGSVVVIDTTCTPASACVQTRLDHAGALVAWSE